VLACLEGAEIRDNSATAISGHVEPKIFDFGGQTGDFPPLNLQQDTNPLQK
jgi:hypothetical protein